MKSFKRYTITAALPYTNGPVHIGHLAGVYLPADIYARFLRQQGKDVVFVCGSDENGIPITLKAKAEGITPQELVDKYHKIIQDSFHRFGISFDIYHRTSSPLHYETAADFFTTLNNKGILKQQVTEQFYDESAGQFLADRYITGTCPNCSFDRAYGDQCENCGITLSPSELIHPHSMLSGHVPIKRETNHWYLPLDQFQDRLAQYILADHSDWKSNVLGQCKSWLDQGLKPRAVTRDLDWGVPVPLPEAKGKVLYVWFDAPIGYISATKALLADSWEKYWKDPDTKLVHFIGKDNIVFHCIIFPAMLMAHGEYILADNVPANEFLNLEGQKISTSRNWAVWLHEYLDDFPGCGDSLRYALCAAAPEAKDNDFTWKEFQARNNNELSAILGNFVNRVAVLCFTHTDGKVPEFQRNLLSEDLVKEMAEIPGKIEKAVLNYRFREALTELMNLARAGNRYLAETEPWKLSPASDASRLNSTLFLALQVCANLAVLSEPFLPDTSAKLYHFLGLQKGQQAGTVDLLAPGGSLTRPELLFRKIEDTEIEQQVQKLEASRAAPAPAPVRGLEPPLPEVTFEQFSALDIRMGTVLSAEKIPKTKKLLRLTVDTGLDRRTVVSGIAEYFAPEDIVGRKVSILLNLAPREIKGITSHGMILMAENAAGVLDFVHGPDDFENGSVIR